ncbi:hypothetical protein DIPPA_24768 [Diplonema papillatum]|nr:hypothetical protein DIPPA_24768 [Diplonema papillatum]
MAHILNRADGLAARLIAKTYATGHSPQTTKKEVRWILRQLLNARVPVAARAFTAAISVVGRVDPAAAVELLGHMDQHRIEPDAVCYDTLLLACARGSLDQQESVAARKRASKLLVSPREIDARLAALAHRKANRGDDVHEAAVKCCDAAVDAEVQLDLFHYAKIIACCNTVDQVQEWLAKIKQTGWTPNSHVFQSAIKVAANANNVEAAERYFNDVRDVAGELPRAGHYQELSRAMRRAQKYDDAQKLWERAQVRPDDGTVTERLALLAECEGPLAAAYAVFESCPPTQATLHALLTCLEGAYFLLQGATLRIAGARICE